MIDQPQFSALSASEYLEQEARSPIKHEYIDGEVYAMAGASGAHITITGNLYVMLRAHLRGRGCQLFFADMKVYVDRRNRFYYPDLLVTCDDHDRKSDYYKEFPVLIIEVLSDSTEARDRGEKLHAYSQLDSLKEYVLISQKQPQIECFRRDNTGQWTWEHYGPGDSLVLTSLDWTGTVDAIYEGIEL